MITDGSVDELGKWYIDPIDFTLHNVDTFTDGKGEALSLENGVITFESGDSRMVFELSDETPDDLVPEGLIMEEKDSLGCLFLCRKKGEDNELYE